MTRKKYIGLFWFFLFSFLFTLTSQAYTYLEMGAGAQALVQEILEQIRPREALILEVVGDEVYINLGQNHVSPGQQFEVFGVGQVIMDPTTQEVLGTTEELRGVIEIIRVRDRTAIGVVAGELRSAIAAQDMAYQKMEGDKRTVAVYRFATASGEISELAWNLQEMVISRLARTHHFQVIERQQIDQILEEYRFSYLGLIEESTAQEAGMLLGADTVLMGSLADLGESIEFNARLTETETGRTLATSSVQVKKDSTLAGMLERILEGEVDEPEERKEPREILLTGIRILPRIGEIRVGKEMTFLARGIDQYGNEIPISPTWVVKGGVGEVYPLQGEQVRFQALTMGSGQLEVTLGALHTVVPLNILPPPRILNQLQVFPQEILLDPQEGIRVLARGIDQYGEYMEVEPYWYVLRGVGKVIPDRGRETFFTATEPGEGTLVAEVAGIRKTIPVDVREYPVLQKIEIKTPEETFIAGESYFFQVLGWDQYGRRIPLSPEWSIQGNIGELILPSGTTSRFLAQEAGEGTVTVSDQQISASLNIQVLAPPVKRLRIEPGDTVLKTGESRTFQVKGLDMYGQERQFEASWKIEGDIGLITTARNDTITFMAQKAGTGYLVVSGEGLTELIQIRVQERTPSSIIINPRQVRIPLGKPYRFTATVLDQDGEAIHVSPHWYVADDIGRLSSTTGRLIYFTPTRRGSGRLIVSYGALRTEVRIQVYFHGIGLTTAQLDSLHLSLPILTFSSGSGITGKETGFSYRGTEYQGDPVHLFYYQSVRHLYLRQKKPSPFLGLRSSLALGYFGEESSRPGEFSLFEFKQGVEGGLLIPIGRRLELNTAYGFSLDSWGLYRSYTGDGEKKEISELIGTYVNLSLRFLF